MSDEHAEPKATIGLVYKLVNELDAKLESVERGVRDEIRSTFREVTAAIESLRDEIPTRRECVLKHDEVDAAIKSAVAASESDRQKLWDALHAVEAQLKWAAALIIGSIGVYILVRLIA